MSGSRGLRRAGAFVTAVLFPFAISAATVVVTEESDLLHDPGCATTGTGTCSLRDAMTFANANSGPDVIHFNIPGPGVHKISPSAYLPTLTDNAGATIDGYSQPGSSANNLPVGSNANLLIEVDGSSIPSGFFGMITAFSDNNVIRGLVLNRYFVNAAVGLLGSNNLVAGNFIGTDPTGLIARSNSHAGISVQGGSGNVIGGTDTASRNVIAGGSQNLVYLGGTGSQVVQGNSIGTNRTGTAALGAIFHGLVIAPGSTGNVIGGLAAGAANLISGNAVSFGNGMYVGTDANSIVGNLVGTGWDGVIPIPNGGHGIFLDQPASDNVINGNQIAFNAQDGVRVGMFQDSAVQRTRISANRIHSNGGLGINLGSDFANDPGDADAGPNGSQNFPLIAAVRVLGAMTQVRGTLNSTPSTLFRVEFFSNASCDPSGHGEGETYLGFVMAPTDTAGNAEFEVTFPIVAGPRDRFTATATDPAGNTSEFSPCASRAANFYTLTPCRVIDTRDPAGPYGGPALAANSERIFPVLGRCGIPSTAQAVAFNLTVTGPTALGDIRAYPAGAGLPSVSTLNYRSGQIRANNAIVPLGAAGDIAVRCVQFSGVTEFIADVAGYFE